MASKHKEAQTFLRKGFFEGLKSFREFEARTEKLANTKEVGDALEILVEAHLHLDQVLKAKNVWVVGDIPLKIRKSLNLPADSKGIDGVYEDASGNIIPYQVKYRTDKETLPYGEVSSFLGITEESLKDRVIFTNARNLAADITKRKGLRGFKAAQFHSLTEEDFNRIHAWLSDKKPAFKRWSPQPHQREAIEKITTALKETDRTTAVMACGTGKTLVALWAAEAQAPKTVLVLVPSLALLSQTLPDWCKQTSWGERFRYLCVCSDASVDRSAKEDEYALKQSDIEFSVTTDAKVVKKFSDQNESGVNVIFSTYQSAEVVAKGLGGKTIDLGIFDEAHKTTGPKKGVFAFGLSDKNIKITKRPFLTATPRHYNLKKRDNDGDLRSISMDDEAVYGKVSYRLSFRAAVAAQIIVPYKVIISVSIKKEVDDELLRRGITLVRKDEIQARWVANQIALKRAIEKTGASKIITFHSRVNLAKDFAGNSARGFKEHIKGFDVFHVNGSQNAADRKGLLDSFRTAEKGLITNARCLTEGVDVPAVDMVAFVDPRKSKIDIAQAAGRAMRQSKVTNKKLGYIMVPLFIEQKKGETEASALARSGFDEIAVVLAAMVENDEDLVDTIGEMQRAQGRGDIFNPRILHEKIEVFGPAIDLSELTKSIDVEILDRLGMAWDKWFGILTKFHKREGHSRVTVNHIEGEAKLGIWSTIQRRLRPTLAPERVRMLDSLGFIWDLFEEQWEEAFAALQKFHKREGHCNVVQGHIEDGVGLGSWVSRQRKVKDLDADKIRKLNSLGFSWDRVSEKREQAFVALQKFHKREGHCNVPQNHIEDGVKLGVWVSTRRSHKSKLSAEMVSKLDSLEFVWNAFDTAWEKNFSALHAFYEREGHSEIPEGHRENGCKIATWTIIQRMKRAELSPDKVRRLDSIGFCWDPASKQWEKGFLALKRFHDREKTYRIPSGHNENGVVLTTWTVNQRRLYSEGALLPSQITKLNSIGFPWDFHLEQWNQGFSALEAFFKREGHCNVPAKHKEGDVTLGVWIRYQRDNIKKLSPNQAERLNSLDIKWHTVDKTKKWDSWVSALMKFQIREGSFDVPKGHTEDGVDLYDLVKTIRRDSGKIGAINRALLDSRKFPWHKTNRILPSITSETRWQEGLRALVSFKAREGHCLVPLPHKEDNIPLGKWVSYQRKQKKILSRERIDRLNELGFLWDHHTGIWTQLFSSLVNFHKREGHTLVPHTHVEDGLMLGTWVGRQRKKKTSLTPNQVKQLDDLGFVWSPHDVQWEEFYELLLLFHARTGNCLVPQRYKEGGVKLGHWVSNQRMMKRTGKLSTERINRLNSVGFTWVA